MDGSMEQTEETLAARWPGRADQIGQVLSLIGRRPSQPGTSFFIHGTSGTGKTSIIRDCIHSTGRQQHAYFEVGNTSKPRHLFSSVLSQLHRVKRKHDKGYAAVVCDNPTDFMVEVAKACPANQASTAFIILDNVHLLAKGTLLQALLHTASYAGANVQFILISRRSWATCEFCEGTCSDGLPQVFFPAYSEEQLLCILKVPSPDTVRSHLERQIWGQYVSGVIYPHFKSASNYVTDLRGLSRTLWDQYISPLRTGQISSTLPLDRVVLSLMSHFKKKHALHTAMTNFEPGLMQSADELLRSNQQGAPAAAEGGGGSCAWGALPRSARLILVAAYLASHNKPSSDRAVFDAASGGTRGGRKRGGAGKKTMDSDRQYEASKEALLKGPSAVNLNRLLNIHNHLYIAAEHSSSVSRRRSTLGGAGIAGGSLCDVCVPSLVVTSEVVDCMERADKEKRQRLEDGRDGPRRVLSAAGMGPQGPGLEGQGHLQGNGNSSLGPGLDGKAQPLLGGQSMQGAGTSTGSLSLGGGVDPGRLSFGGSGNPSRLSLVGCGDPGRLSIGGGDPGRLSLGGPGGAQGGARLSGGSSMWGLRDTDAAAGAGNAVLVGQGWGGGGHTVRQPGSHLPHPASGVLRHGKAHMSPEATGVFSTIASLASMGLLLREKSDDPLEAPRFTVAINKSLAADLARSMGLDIHSYLKLA